MKAKVYTPHPALQEFIHNIGVYGADFTESGLSNMYRFVPSYQRYIMFYLEDPVKVQRVYSNEFVEKSVSLTVGPLEKTVWLDMGRKHLALGVAFKPGGLFRLLNVHMTELHEQDFDTQLFLGREIDEINNQLKEHKSNWDRMVFIVETWLLKKVARLKPSIAVDLVMENLIQNAGNISIEKMAYDANISIRQFERKCVERTGMSPKRYARLIRFCKAYHLKENFPDATWTTIAHMSGYYDQMHFIRDFKEFAGITPSIIREEELKSTIRLHSFMT
ncbi:transcriptional regulator, AraC family [Chitinophaga jiangningensis]|uniref:Transcriptional regulator, AraC family n=1 Tax=Chitinophaga jiangningensis TaxID=1419482 RepID=A0A1M7LVT6_9BACT|nr:helix-turn-helix domain-containing protein [Chitinophaga jiangningensis]SHM81905.1 transcriptional regulator, AraC family [Chitinophaga jiangningensis]